MEPTNGDTAAVVAGKASEGDDEAPYTLKFCTVCASNQNRYSMFPSQRQQ